MPGSARSGVAIAAAQQHSAGRVDPAIGGSWLPLSVEPQWLQGAAKVSLNAWAMEGFNGLMIYGKGFAQMLPNIGVLFLYGILCCAVAVHLFRFHEV